MSESIQRFTKIEGLDKAQLEAILDKAEQFLGETGDRLVYQPLLQGRSVVNLFCEPSTRTRCSFELAAYRLGANVLNFDVDRSAFNKGETLIDTVQNLAVMQPDILVVRHGEEGIVDRIADEVGADLAVINGGDGAHAHPTQAMLDSLTIRQQKQSFTRLKVAVIGDIRHSRVARSQISALTILGVPEIRLVAPKELLPEQINPAWPVTCYENMEEGLKDADVVVALRVQLERIKDSASFDRESFHEQYGLTEKTLAYAASDAIVLHPGPMNRGVEISDAVADGPKSVILDQVRNGVTVRMAIMWMLMENRN